MGFELCIRNAHYTCRVGTPNKTKYRKHVIDYASDEGPYT